MKKFFYLLASITISLVVIIACEKPLLEIDDIQSTNVDEIYSKVKEKVRLCHGDETGGYITQPISQNAAKAHLAHGDRYVYSPKEVWTIIKENINNGVIHFWDVDVNQFDGTNFSGSGTYNWNLNPPWDPPNYILTYLKVWGTVDNTNGDMDIYLEWDFTAHPSYPGKRTFNFGGTSCMCSGIFEVYSYNPTHFQQFSLDQDTSIPCVTY